MVHLTSLYGNDVTKFSKKRLKGCLSLSSSSSARRDNMEKGQPRHSSIRLKKIGEFWSARTAFAIERWPSIDVSINFQLFITPACSRKISE